MLAKYPSYVGVDISPTAIARCKDLFRADLSKRFVHASEYNGDRAELAVSLDVIYHLVEDAVFEKYMNAVFDAATKYVIIFSSNSDKNLNSPAHVRHRRFTNWINEHELRWRLIGRIPNKYSYRGDSTKGSFADFHIYEHRF